MGRNADFTISHLHDRARAMNRVVKGSASVSEEGDLVVIRYHVTPSQPITRNVPSWDMDLLRSTLSTMRDIAPTKGILI